ncbi:MAG: glycosyltransferase [Lachnospiraceae bacterium]|nr:glycosyltransferase [Lachnospiraceae bacterium]
MISYLREFSYDDDNRVYIWGISEFGKKLCEFLTLSGVIVSGFFDNAYPEGLGTDDSSTKSLNDLNELLPERTIFVIATNYEKEVKEQLTQYGFYRIVVKDMLAMRHIDQLDPIVFKREETPEVSVCITAYNGWEMTYNCIKSLYENNNQCRYEVILGDNASTDETKNAERYFKNIKIIHHEENLQYLGNVNEITKYAKGEFIFLLANDILFTKKRYIDELLKYLRTDSRIGMITGRLWVPSKQKYDVHSFYVKCGVCEEPVLDKPKNVENMWPVATLIPKRVWEESGGYDPIFLPVYYEDTDLEMRIIHLGYDLVSYPWAEVIHYQGATYTQDMMNQEHFKRNNAIFRERWQYYIDNEKEKREEYIKRRN